MDKLSIVKKKKYILILIYLAQDQGWPRGKGSSLGSRNPRPTPYAPKPS